MSHGLPVDEHGVVERRPLLEKLMDQLPPEAADPRAMYGFPTEEEISIVADKADVERMMLWLYAMKRGLDGPGLCDAFGMHIVPSSIPATLLRPPSSKNLRPFRKRDPVPQVSDVHPDLPPAWNIATRVIQLLMLFRPPTAEETAASKPRRQWLGIVCDLNGCVVHICNTLHATPADVVNALLGRDMPTVLADTVTTGILAPSVTQGSHPRIIAPDMRPQQPDEDNESAERRIEQAALLNRLMRPAADTLRHLSSFAHVTASRMDPTSDMWADCTHALAHAISHIALEKALAEMESRGPSEGAANPPGAAAAAAASSDDDAGAGDAAPPQP